MQHLWIRGEQRLNEARVGLTPDGIKNLRDAGFKITVEHSAQRAIAINEYRAAGCYIAPEFSWPNAPAEAVILGLKELPEDGTPLRHQHIMFGHAFKGQRSGKALLSRFAAGGGTLYDLEYLVDKTGRRLAAFGYWAGFAGAAVSLKCWAAQHRSEPTAPLAAYAGKPELISDLTEALSTTSSAIPRILVIGALGRVGSGASALCKALNLEVTKWDLAETAKDATFPEILQHEIFLNCILASPETPVLFKKSALDEPRTLRVIGDISCDLDSDYNPIPVNKSATSWSQPARRVHAEPPLYVMAIDNLPSLLPVESSQDFSRQLLPLLKQLASKESDLWQRARETFKSHLKEL